MKHKLATASLLFFTAISSQAQNMTCYTDAAGYTRCNMEDSSRSGSSGINFGAYIEGAEAARRQNQQDLLFEQQRRINEQQRRLNEQLLQQQQLNQQLLEQQRFGAAPEWQRLTLRERQDDGVTAVCKYHNEGATFYLADSSTRCNKDEPGDGWLRMSRHHGHSNRQVQVARCTSTSAEKNDTKFTAS